VATSVSPPGWAGVTPSLIDAAVLLVGRRSPRLAALGCWLDEEGCAVQSVGRLIDSLDPTMLYRPDVVVLDGGRRVPALVGGLREWTDLPVIAIGTGRSEALGAALDAGADDYLVLPLVRPEVVARLRAVLRRRRSPRADEAIGPGATVATPHFELDLITHHAVIRDRTGSSRSSRSARVSRSTESVVHLTPTEWRIVEVLVRRPGVLVAQSDLLAMVWGEDRQGHNHALRVHLSSIRHKLEPDQGRPRYFTTETGAGLRFVAPG
jgi:two-component system KDP operon response regulator KdpE